MKNLTHLQTDKNFVTELNNFNQKIKVLITPRKDMIFQDYWKELKPVFLEKQNYSCAICEKECNDIYSSDIEHYRPKTHYWWLAYESENYFLSCAECNRTYKKDKFPLIDETKKVTFNTKNNISQEEPLLLNPIYDKHFEYFKLVFLLHSVTGKGIVILKSKEIEGVKQIRASKTIEIYNLDLNSYKTSTDKSRFRLLNDFYNNLLNIAIEKNKLKKEEFKEYFKSCNPKLKKLGLTELILRGQFEINFLF